MYTKNLMFHVSKGSKNLIEPGNIPLTCWIVSLFIQTFKGVFPYDFYVFPVQVYKTFPA